MGFGMFGMVLFWGLVIFAIVVLVQRLGGSSASGAPLPKSALDILDERYARGDIDKQEFEEKKRSFGK